MQWGITFPERIGRALNCTEGRGVEYDGGGQHGALQILSVHHWNTLFNVIKDLNLNAEFFATLISIIQTCWYTGWGVK